MNNLFIKSWKISIGLTTDNLIPDYYSQFRTYIGQTWTIVM